MIPTVFDHHFDNQKFYQYVNGFDKESFCNFLIPKFGNEFYESFIKHKNYELPLIINIPWKDLIRDIDSTDNKFSYFIGIHWWMTFESDTNKFIYNNISINEKILTYITQKKCKIVLYNCYEGWSESVWICSANQIINRYPQLTLDDFVVVSNNCSKMKILKSITVLSNQMTVQLPDILDSEKFFSIRRQAILNSINLPYRFISLNRRPKSSRWAIMTLLFDDRPIGLLSFGIYTPILDQTNNDIKTIQEYATIIQKKLHDENSEEHISMMSFKFKYPKIYELFESKQIINHLPLLLPEKTDLRTNPFSDFHHDKYLNSYLHIVTETYFSNQQMDVIHLSEKIFKPIWFLQPFVVFAPTGTLEVLKVAGYKTFDQWINESYDNILDDESRLIAAVSAAKTFYKQPKKQLNGILQEMLPVLVHNYNTLLQNRNSLVDKFIIELDLVLGDTV